MTSLRFDSDSAQSQPHSCDLTAIADSLCRIGLGPGGDGADDDDDDDDDDADDSGGYNKAMTTLSGQCHGCDFAAFRYECVCVSVCI